MLDIVRQTRSCTLLNSLAAAIDGCVQSFPTFVANTNHHAASDNLYHAFVKPTELTHDDTNTPDHQFLKGSRPLHKQVEATGNSTKPGVGMG